jgi:hypothetical protein
MIIDASNLLSKGKNELALDQRIIDYGRRIIDGEDVDERRFAETIREVVDKDLDLLGRALYWFDLDERAIDETLNEKPLPETAERLAKLMIERARVKRETQARYLQGEPLEADAVE